MYKKVKYLISNLILVFLFSKLVNSSKLVTKISVGFVYCYSSELIKVEDLINDLNSELVSINSKSKIKIELKPLKLSENENTISLSLSVCQNLMAKEPVFSVIIGKTDCLHKKTNNDNSNLENDYILTLSAISFTCAYYQIPVLDLYNRESAFSDKVIFRF